MRKPWGVLIFTLGIAMAGRAGVSAQPAFTSENKNLFTFLSVQDVVASSAGFRMYLNNGGIQILSASTTDQTHWTLDAGVRLSPGAVFALDGASITACGLLPTAGGSYRMFYVGLSTAGKFNVLSATSADGLVWAKEAGVRFRNPNGSGFIDSPRPFDAGGGLTRLFYVNDIVGQAKAADLRIYAATSTDTGVTSGVIGAVLPNAAFQVAVTTLTDGRYRLYYSIGASSPTQIVSAVSANGSSFANEAGVRYSTSAGSFISNPVVIRSTESFRWRMFSNIAPPSPALPFVTSALTLTPVLTSISPTSILTSQSTGTLTFTGEIFSPTPAAALSIGLASVHPMFNAVAVNDLKFTADFNPISLGAGFWDANASDPDLSSATLARALFIDVPAGTVAIKDNLFRPLLGGKASISVTTFDNGQLTAKLYTVNGERVATLFDQAVSAGTTSFTWDGATGRGTTVASGVYFLKVVGPKLNTIQKIVVIK